MSDQNPKEPEKSSETSEKKEETKETTTVSSMEVDPPKTAELANFTNVDLSKIVQDLNVVSTSKLFGDEQVDAVRKDIENWKIGNTFLRVQVDKILKQDFSIHLKIGPTRIPVVIYNNSNWQPMFLSTDNSDISEYVVPLNTEIEEQAHQGTPLTFSVLLTMFALHVNEAIANLKPQTSFFPLPSYNTSEEPVEAINYVDPKPEDWNLISQEVQAALKKENFQKYEIDEWLRRITLLVQKGDFPRALQLIAHDILGGARVPKAIAQFFNPKVLHGNTKINASKSETGIDSLLAFHGSDEATGRLKTELLEMKDIDSKSLGFTAAPINNDLYLWSIKLFGFGEDSQLFKDLMEWTVTNVPMNDSTAKLDMDIQIEMKFPSNYPHSAPLFRVIRPRFENIDADLKFVSKRTTPEITTTTDSRAALSVSRVLEKSKDSWDPSCTALEMIQQIRTFFIESGAKVDMSATLAGSCLPTVGNFWRSYNVVSPKTAQKEELEGGGKIVMPTAALEELSVFDLEHSAEIPSPNNFLNMKGWKHMSTPHSAPMIFEISTEKGKRTFCGVEEFTAPEGNVVVPQWIMGNLGISEKASLQVRRVDLPSGVFLKLQPHSTDFLEVNDPKAMLEWVLPRFVVLSVGDTIVVPYRNKKYHFDVLEVRPGRAIKIIDSDINLEFAAPLSGNLDFGSSPSKSQTPSMVSPGKQEDDKKADGKTLGSHDSSNQTLGVDYKVCGNCKRNVPIGSFVMHEATCARMNWYCDSCGTVVQRTKKDDHIQEFHSKVFCECGLELEKKDLDHHKKSQCPQRIVKCSFCPLEMHYVELFSHEQKCGSQTEKCEVCRKYVQKKDMMVHMVECAEKTEKAKFLEEEIKANQSQRRNSFPSVVPAQKRGGDDVMLCPECMHPFVDDEELQIHIFTAHDQSQQNQASSEASTTETTTTTATTTSTTEGDASTQTTTTNNDNAGIDPNNN